MWIRQKNSPVHCHDRWGSASKKQTNFIHCPVWHQCVCPCEPDLQPIVPTDETTDHFNIHLCQHARVVNLFFFLSAIATGLIDNVFLLSNLLLASKIFRSSLSFASWSEQSLFMCGSTVKSPVRLFFAQDLRKIIRQYPLLAPLVHYPQMVWGCVRVLVHSTGIVRNELKCANVVHTSSSFRPHTHTHTHTHIFSYHLRTANWWG